MHIAVQIEKNTFRDSVYLMRLSSLIRSINGIEGAEVIMGTDHNKNFLKQDDLLTPGIIEGAGANDMIIVVKAKDKKAAKEAIEEALNELNKEVGATINSEDGTAFTIDAAIKKLPGANLALISIPGQYVEREALKLLEAGLNIFIFSDNVSIETEIMLKKIGIEKNLLVMGPDCGTAIINGIPIAFANEINRGHVGIVAAAGTGLQEVSCLIHNMGEGISQGIGTGGRDVKETVGGITMLAALATLIDDHQTKVIVVVSKPPSLIVAEKVIGLASKSNKPVVLNFIGANPSSCEAENCIFAETLKDAAEKAVLLLKNGRVDGVGTSVVRVNELVEIHKKSLQKGQKYLRGLFSGGTLAYEAMLILHKYLDGIYSNISLDPNYKLDNSFSSKAHTIIDLGEDEFTQGRPHPMIEPSLRNRFIIEESKDPETAVIMLDIVLGYGSHPDPAGQALKAIREASKEANLAGRNIVFVAYVCGTDKDPQNRTRQIQALESEGVLTFPSNADAATFVGELLK